MESLGSVANNRNETAGIVPVFGKLRSVDQIFHPPNGGFVLRNFHPHSNTEEVLEPIGKAKPGFVVDSDVLQVFHNILVREFRAIRTCNWKGEESLQVCAEVSGSKNRLIECGRRPESRHIRYQFFGNICHGKESRYRHEV